MRNGENASISMAKIICIFLILIACSGIGVVVASNATARNIKVVFPNDYELNIISTKTKIADIINENHILLLENETVEPGLNENIGEDGIIQITKENTESKIEEIDQQNSMDLKNIGDLYTTIVEKIISLEVEIPYETVTKDVSATDTADKTTKVLQEGENGLKVILYKITYKDDIEVDRLELETRIIKMPVDKIVQVTSAPVSRSGSDRLSQSIPVSSNVTSLAQKVENIEPKVVTLNASAYTASTCGKMSTDSGYGITASGDRAQSWYTVAAGKGYPIGTIMYIPYFADKPNGGWFVVQDRGSAISNSKVDIYMDTYSECKAFGRRNLECYIYEY